jgi:peptide-methionine (S)-S-oxide reductase
MEIVENKEIAIFGGGCFWCTEAVFKMLRGVFSVLPGYAGGTTKNPTSSQVSTGVTGHVECVKVEFNPKEISYIDLLTVFFASHDPTSLNKQGNDVGTQYRSVVFYTTPEQKTVAEMFIKELNDSSQLGKAIVTTIEPLTIFYVAENYQHDFYENNKQAPYCQIIINPKLDKVQKQFAHLLVEKIKRQYE